MTQALAIRDMNTLPALSASSVNAYISAVNQIPMLTVEEEHELGQRLHDEGDTEAAKRMILSHLRFVVHVARGYTGYGLALPDLIQEGNVGLMKAVKRFDPSHGVRLVSFAVHWIKAEIHEFVIRNWRIVKVATTKAQRKLFFNLRSSKKRLGWFTQAEVNAVANDLGVTPEQVLEMENRLSANDAAFDPIGDLDDDDTPFAPAAYLEDHSFDPARKVEHDDWDNQNSEKLVVAMDTLDTRSRDILEKRWLSDDKTTLHELADQYGVSAERIRQLESNAIKKLRTSFAA